MSDDDRPRTTGEEYVALGDSYSTGLGTFSDGGGTCHRSVLAYPALVAASYGLDLVLRACPGATIPDVVATQLDVLGPSTAYVTVTAGGNDAGFGPVLTECALPAWASDGAAAIEGAQDWVESRLRPDLLALYAGVREHAPEATVVAVGYPQIFAGEDCNAFTWFSPDELAGVNATADLINAETAAAAQATGCLFADPVPVFLGHAVCQDEWVNGLSYPVEASYHPNRSGHALGYAPLVGPVLTGRPAPDRDLRSAADVAADIARREPAWAEADASVLPKPVQAPDLHSTRVLLAARRAGVDVDDPGSVAAADERYAAVRVERRSVLHGPGRRARP